MNDSQTTGDLSRAYFAFHLSVSLNWISGRKTSRAISPGMSFRASLIIDGQIGTCLMRQLLACTTALCRFRILITDFLFILCVSLSNQCAELVHKHYHLFLPLPTCFN